jgi:1-hydroxycarotenoid 3,4-desaturase
VRRRVFARLERLGLRVDLDDAGAAVEQFAPEQFEQLYPGTGGALYGSATHGWRASFERPGASTGIAGLYLAGGSVHPGPGVPMAALSGRLAAQRVLADR